MTGASAGGPSPYSLELRSLRKTYGDVEAVKSLDLNVERGEFLTVLGPSGSGKTTVLRLIVGFTLPTSGHILLESRDVSRMTPAERGIGMVFQNYALFPHMTVAENIAYGLKMRGWPKDQRDKRVAEMQELIGLGGLGRRLPRELSGGQQQRVALARALAFEPAVLLMDEPLGALDRELRIRMAAELRRIHRELATTMIYVTHDREEALTLSDRIAIMHVGVLEAIDTPHRLFTKPATRFVASFLGGHNLLPATLLDHSGNGKVAVQCLGQRIDVTTSANPRATDNLWLAVPPTAVGLAPTDVSTLRMQAQVVETLYTGDSVEVTCAVDGVGNVAARLSMAEAGGLEPPVAVELFARLESAVVVTGRSGPDEDLDDEGLFGHDQLAAQPD
jgi:putative spermidine/putrescine transport system ATP-binding protein